MDRPYTNVTVTDKYIIRRFDKDVDSEELYWHRDDEHRVVEVLECGKGWAVQFDNEIPFSIDKGTTIFIFRHEWHRVIKGSGDLLIKIHKHGQN